jgi:hypothetical protein
MEARPHFAPLPHSLHQLSTLALLVPQALVPELEQPARASQEP